MHHAHKVALRAELARRGYSEAGIAPNESMSIGDELLDTVTLAELLDVMVSRREKIFRDAAIVGPTAAKQSYDDVVAAVDAIKSTIDTIAAP